MLGPGWLPPYPAAALCLPGCQHREQTSLVTRHNEHERSSYGDPWVARASLGHQPAHIPQRLSAVQLALLQPHGPSNRLTCFPFPNSSPGQSLGTPQHQRVKKIDVNWLPLQSCWSHKLFNSRKSVLIAV